MSFITGTTDFHYAGEIFKTWYKVVGSLDGTQCPLITLHGGPGMSHDYILPHSRLYELYGIPVIFYDQIGIGKSTHLPDKPKEFWTSELFMDELENLLQSLGVSSDFDLLGCSWGGMLGLWVESQKKLLQGLDKDVQEALTKLEQAGTTHDPEYKAGMGLFYKKHANRLETWPEELLKSVAIYHTMFVLMNGPSEFCITGFIKTWLVIDLLKNVDYTTLITNLEYDMAQDIAVLPFFKHLAKVKWVKFHNASHHPFWEIPEEYLKVVGEFLTV
ncbi:proline-specific peptidase [Lentinula novae-zelandiae]|nr:proline-specific peptidase [Lentinula novae-zelandiae]